MTKQERVSIALFGSDCNAAHLSRLAQSCGVSYSTMYRWRKNPDDIPFGKLKKIAQLRGVKLEDLEK